MSAAGAVTLRPATGHPVLGIGLMILAGTLFVSMDTAIRYMGAFVPVLLMLSTRYLVQAVVMGVWIGLHPRLSFRSAHPRFQATRGALLLATSAMSFFGLQYIPVAEFTAINLLTPVLVTLLAARLLHEQVPALRWLLLAGCGVGALVVIRPGSGLFGWAVLFPLGCVAFYSAFQVLTRRLAQLEDPLTTHFWTGAVGTALVLPVLLASPVPVAQVLAAAPAWQLAMLLLIGLLGSFGHLVLILAFGMAPASRLMPFMYVQIGTAALLGGWFLSQWPDAWGWAGMALIAACGVASAWLPWPSAAQPAPVQD